MNIVDVVLQLRTYATALGNRVAGVGDFVIGVESVTNLPMPAAFVYGLTDDAEASTDLNGLNQIVIERFAVTVIFDVTTGTLADSRTGFQGANQVENMKELIWSSILNWIPPSMVGKAARGIMYDSGELITYDRSRLIWQFVFRMERTITDADGFWQVPPDLDLIEATIANPDTGATEMVVDIDTSGRAG